MILTSTQTPTCRSWSREFGPQSRSFRLVWYQLHATRVFVRVAAWQNVVTYLVYVIMLLNVIITTFGMSGEDGGGLGERHIPPLGPPMSRVGRGRRTGVGA